MEVVRSDTLRNDCRLSPTAFAAFVTLFAGLVVFRRLGPRLEWRLPDGKGDF